MIRTQVQLTERQAQALKSLAARKRLSFSAALRSCVDRGLISEDAGAQSEKFSGFLGLSGRFRDVKKRRDLAQAHDELLDDAFR